jgi:hypothetical protein
LPILEPTEPLIQWNEVVAASRLVGTEGAVQGHEHRGLAGQVAVPKQQPEEQASESQGCPAPKSGLFLHPRDPGLLTTLWQPPTSGTRHQVLRVHPELLQYVRMLLEVDLIWQLPRRPIRMLGPHLFLDQVGQSVTTALSE